MIDDMQVYIANLGKYNVTSHDSGRPQGRDKEETEGQDNVNQR